MVQIRIWPAWYRSVYGLPPLHHIFSYPCLSPMPWLHCYVSSFPCLTCLLSNLFLVSASHLSYLFLVSPVLASSIVFSHLSLLHLSLSSSDLVSPVLYLICFCFTCSLSRLSHVTNVPCLACPCLACLLSRHSLVLSFLYLIFPLSHLFLVTPVPRHIWHLPHI
jgi:hypothetical protein